MPYNEKLADRVRDYIAQYQENIEEKKMFGGLCFMVNDKMCVGVESERLMVRLHPDLQDEALEQEGAAPMDFTGKPMKGYVFVNIGSLHSNKQLHYWLDHALAYNAIAKASKKKKK